MKDRLVASERSSVTMPTRAARLGTAAKREAGRGKWGRPAISEHIVKRGKRLQTTQGTNRPRAR